MGNKLEKIKPNGYTSRKITESFTPIIPETSLVSSIHESISKRIYGQEEAVWAVARAIARHETGLNDPQKPLASLMFLGPTGVGKTEMAKVLATYLHGDTHALKIIDCGMLTQSHAISRLTGAPPGYVGYGDEGLITPNDLIGRNVIVFDEIEKAHPSFWRLLLPVMDEGRLTIRQKDIEQNSANTHTIEEDLIFCDSFIIFTSNVGAQAISELNRPSLGLTPANKQKPISATAIKAMEQHFACTPEFLGRLDEIIVFKPLQSEQYQQIFWRMLHDKNSQILDRIPDSPIITVTDECAQYLIEKAVGRGHYGARDIKSVINTILLQPFSDIISEIPRESLIVADINPDNQITFYLDNSKNKHRHSPENINPFTPII